jgi:hypothetical protein
MVSGNLIVYCDGDMNFLCDFKERDDINKIKCKYNHSERCGNREVFDILIENENDSL